MAQRTLTAREGDPTRGTSGRTVEREPAICPLCGVETADARVLYVHLQTGHRKSTLAGMVLRG